MIPTLGKNSKRKESYRPILGFPDGSVVKNLPANAGDASSVPGLGRSSGEGNGKPGKSPGQRSLAGYSPWGCERVRHD